MGLMGSKFLMRFSLFSITYAQELPKATIVTRVMPIGERVVAVILEYSSEINTNNLKPDMFSVETNLEGNFMKRIIRKVYANNNGELLPANFTNQGKFLVLELDPKEPSAITATHDFQRLLSKRLKLEYRLEQKVNIRSIDGKEFLPTSLTTSEEKHLIIDEFHALI